MRHEFRVAEKIFLFWLNELVPAFTNLNAAFTGAGGNSGWTADRLGCGTTKARMRTITIKIRINPSGVPGSGNSNMSPSAPSEFANSDAWSPEAVRDYRP